MKVAELRETLELFDQESEVEIEDEYGYIYNWVLKGVLAQTITTEDEAGTEESYAATVLQIGLVKIEPPEGFIPAGKEARAE